MKFACVALLAVLITGCANLPRPSLRGILGPDGPTVAEYAEWVDKFGPEAARKMLEAGVSGQRAIDAAQDARWDALENETGTGTDAQILKDERGSGSKTVPPFSEFREPIRIEPPGGEIEIDLGPLAWEWNGEKWVGVPITPQAVGDHRLIADPEPAISTPMDLKIERIMHAARMRRAGLVEAESLYRRARGILQQME